MSEMVDRVVAALNKAGCDNPHFEMEALARAAIAAMREPTDAMLRTGVDLALKTSLGGDYGWPDYIRDKHRAMIDAALDEART